MIITFSGLNGAGKTHISKLLAEQLGWEWYGMGTIMRADAAERGMSIEEHDRFVADNPDIDERLDERVVRLGERGDEFVLDARAGWHFIPHSKKVFLTADEQVRARRAFEGGRESEKYASVEQAASRIRSRIEVVRERLRSLYGIDVYDPQNFDLVIDTSALSPQEVVDRVRAAFQL